MSKKDLHIVYGGSAKAVLTQSNYLNVGQSYICCFDDSLSTGPLCDLEETLGIKRRKRWWETTFGCIADEDGGNLIDNNIIRLQALIANVNQYKRIYLWLGNGSDEMITMARLLAHLPPTSIPILRPDFSKSFFRSVRADQIVNDKMKHLKAEDVPELAKTFQELTPSDIYHFKSLWTTLLADKGIFHIFNKEGAYRDGDERFFDTALLKRCTADYQNSALIVGYTLGDLFIENSCSDVGDIFLFHRLNKLGDEGKVEIIDRADNTEQDSWARERIFKVRLAR